MEQFSLFRSLLLRKSQPGEAALLPWMSLSGIGFFRWFYIDDVIESPGVQIYKYYISLFISFATQKNSIRFEVFFSISAHWCYLDIKLLLEYRLKPEFFVKPDEIVNYQSLCGISVEVCYVILVVL